MTKGGTLWKLKRMIKKWKSHYSKSSEAGLSTLSVPEIDLNKPSEEEGCCRSRLDQNRPTGTISGYQTVYVGQSRRRYVIRSEHMNHPLVRELVAQPACPDSVVIGCEVVLFEHLLWMLENADPPPDSIDELAGFYAS